MSYEGQAGEPYFECVHCGECYALGYSYCVRDEGDD